MTTSLLVGSRRRVEKAGHRFQSKDEALIAAVLALRFICSTKTCEMKLLGADKKKGRQTAVNPAAAAPMTMKMRRR